MHTAGYLVFAIYYLVFTAGCFVCTASYVVFAAGYLMTTAGCLGITEGYFVLSELCCSVQLTGGHMPMTLDVLHVSRGREERPCWVLV